MNNNEKLQITLDNFLFNLLNNEYDENTINQIINGYKTLRKTTFRINNLKSNQEEVIKELDNNNIKYNTGPIKDSFIIDNNNYQNLIKTNSYEKGYLYIQNLSSMIPPYVLDFKDNTIDILDMTAAPGSKTSLISQLIVNNNKAHILACEKDKIRYERLKYNLQKLGCNNVSVLNQDATKLDEYFLFDNILLDAPCSGSGTLSIYDNSLDNFSLKLIKNSSILQIKLLNQACKILKKGGEIVYSTCSILKQENEDVINKVLSYNKNIEVVPINLSYLDKIPLLPSTINGTLKVMPNDEYEGFFVCKKKIFSILYILI